MSITFSEVPKGFDLSCHKETQSSLLPQVRRSNRSIFIPVFVREERTENSVIYRYFDVEVPFECQNLSDYDGLCLTCYAEIRRALYGPPEFQQSLRDECRWEAHRLAVRTAFPKYAGEVQPGVTRFQEIYSSFWTTINQACEATGHTLADLPEYFTGEQLFQIAVEWGITGDTLTGLTLQIMTVSINLLQNNRNWSELFG